MDGTFQFRNWPYLLGISGISEPTTVLKTAAFFAGLARDLCCFLTHSMRC